MTRYRAEVLRRNLDYLAGLRRELLRTKHFCCAEQLTHIMAQALNITEREMLRLVTVREAAEISGVDCSTIRRWIRAGWLTRYGGDGERLKVRFAELPAPGNALLQAIQELRTQYNLPPPPQGFAKQPQK